MVGSIVIEVQTYVSADIEQEDKPQQRVVAAEVVAQQEVEVDDGHHGQQYEVHTPCQHLCRSGQEGGECHQSHVARGKPVAVEVQRHQRFAQVSPPECQVRKSEEQCKNNYRVEEYRRPCLGNLGPLGLGRTDEEVSGDEDVAVGGDLGEASCQFHGAEVEQRGCIGAHAHGFVPDAVHQEVPDDDEEHRHHAQYFEAWVTLFGHDGWV